MIFQNTHPVAFYFQKSAKVRRHDDESLDDIAEMQKESRKRKDKDERKSMDRRRRGILDLFAIP